MAKIKRCGNCAYHLCSFSTGWCINEKSKYYHDGSVGANGLCELWEAKYDYDMIEDELERQIKVSRILAWQNILYRIYKTRFRTWLYCAISLIIMAVLCDQLGMEMLAWWLAAVPSFIGILYMLPAATIHILVGRLRRRWVRETGFSVEAVSSIMGINAPTK